MGRLVKDYSPVSIGAIFALMLGLAGCIASGRNDRYAGAVEVEEGVCGPVNGGAHLVGSLQIRGDQALFAPDEGVVLLQGRIDATGHVTASTTAPGPDHKAFTMVFEGDLRGNTVEGRYATPHCRATVRLHRVT